MDRGVDVGLYLAPGLANADATATELGNLAAFELAGARHELLVWQVFRVNTDTSHHYRLAVRHPRHRFDLGFSAELGRKLRELSDETEKGLRQRFEGARASGLRPVALRIIREEVDFWQDDLWTALGGPASVALPVERV